MKLFKIMLIIFIAVIATFFIYSVFEMIKKFDEFSNIAISKTPYILKAKEIKVTNSRTLGIDTLQFKGIQLLNFWASWCRPCIDEQSSLEELQKIKKKIRVIQLSFDSLDNQQKIFNKFGWTLPAYFIIDTNIFQIPGLLPKSYLLKDTIVIQEIYGSKKWDDSNMIKFIDSLIR